MPFYDFKCNECDNVWEEMTTYDKTNVYPKIICPNCESSNKVKLMPENFSIGGPTAAKMGRFNYRAGYNLEKAKGERRKAEAASHMGSNPYSDLTTKDFNLGEGIHDPATRLGLS